jgi:hypothetical protein
MADYFTRFSLIVILPTEAAQQYAINLSHQGAEGSFGDPLPAGFPPSLSELVEDWHFEVEPENSSGTPGIWIHSDAGGIDAACAFIQHLLQRFDPESRVTFEWSHDCSKPRVDAFGGGAAIITAKEIKTMSTSQWLEQNVR